MDSFYTSAMVSRFRTALMWLLLLALPLQGFAAATMLNCGPNHHRMLAAATAGSTRVHAHAAVDHHEMAKVGGGSDLSSVHHLDKVTKFKCSACAACCLGAALPTAAIAIVFIPPAATLAVFVSASHVDFLSGGLDRPPRLLLA